MIKLVHTVGINLLPMMDEEAGEILGSARRVVEPHIGHGDVHVSVDGDDSPRDVRLVSDW